jgi:hypothetical protein
MWPMLAQVIANGPFIVPRYWLGKNNQNGGQFKTLV